MFTTTSPVEVEQSTIPLTPDEIDNGLNAINGYLARTLKPVKIFISVMFTVGIMENIIVCVVFIWRMKRGTQNILISSLAVVDLLGCAVEIPIDVIVLNYHFSFTWIVLCKAGGFFKTIFVLTSIQILIAIAVDRYLKVCRPFKTQLKTVSAKLVVGCAVCVAIIIGCPILFIFDTVVVDTGYPGISGKVCTYCKNTPTIIYYISLCCLFACYTTILAFMYGSVGLAASKRRGRYQSASQSGALTPTSALVAAKNAIYDILLTDKATTIGFAISLVFLLSYMPVLTLRMISLTIPKFPTIHKSTTYAAYNILVRSYLFNSVGNPLIYGLLNEDFQKEVALLTEESLRRIVLMARSSFGYMLLLKEWALLKTDELRTMIQQLRSAPSTGSNPYARTIDVYTPSSADDDSTAKATSRPLGF